MFFFAHLGSQETVPDWKRTVERHASWLGLSPSLQSRPIAGGGVFSFGWISLRPPDTASLVRETPDHIALVTMQPLEAWGGEFAPPKGFETRAVQLDVSLPSGRVRVAMPAIGTEQFFWTHDARGWAFANDMRLLILWAGFELDDAGVHGLFKYDVIPAPLTISRTVGRVPDGWMLTAEPDQDEPRLEATFHPPSSPPEPSQDDPTESVRQALDHSLSRVPIGSTLLFSGGTDSGVMASRLAALGRTDVTLLNFTSGSEDLDGKYAQLMARHLGLRCEQVVWNPADMSGVLPRLGLEYSFPFNDTATIPSLLLMHSIAWAEHRIPALVEGTGAASFSAANTSRVWKPVYWVPREVRRLVGLACPLKLWPYRSKIARVAATMRRSTDMPRELVPYAHTSLAGVAYQVEDEAAARLEGAVQDWLDVRSVPPDPADQTWMVWCERLGISTGKFFDPARRLGIPCIFPHIEPAMLQAALGLSWDQRCPPGRSKLPMVQLMARNVPKHLIERPKRGLLLPYEEAFGHRIMQDFVRDVALSPQNPILPLCRPGALHRILSRAESGKPLSVAARRFLWAFVFASAWIQQVTAAP